MTGRRWAALLVVLVLASGCSSTGRSSPTTGPPSTGAPSSGLPSTATTTTRPGDRRPNIVFVLTDDLSTNLLPYLPHVQAMAKAGASFDRYVVTDSLCCPSRASMFSGRFPHDTKVFTNLNRDGGFHTFHQRDEEASTWGTDLQRAGYRTAFMGKYLNGYQPTFTYGGSRPYVPPGWNVWVGAGDAYREYAYDLNVDGRVVHHGRRPVDYLTDVLATRAVSFVQRSAALHRPFAIEVATFAPHAPSTPAPRDQTAFARVTAPRSPAYDRLAADAPPWERAIAPLTAVDRQQIDKQFRKRVRSVQAVDRMIGRLQQALAAAGVSRDTYLVFGSDNGFHMGEHRLRPGKQTAFDTDVRVPLVVVGPGVAAGRRVPQLAENIDLRPTFDDWAGATVPSAVDGRSLVPALAGPTPGWRTAALVEHHGPDRQPGDPDVQPNPAGNPPSYGALRGADWLYVEYVDGEHEYYDLATDPDELTNRYPSLPAAARARLHRRLQAVERCHGGRSCRAAQRF